MKIAVRRRLAVGALLTTSALLTGLVVAPAANAGNILAITPSGALNNDDTEVLTLRTESAFPPKNDQVFGVVGPVVTLTRPGTTDSFAALTQLTDTDPFAPTADFNFKDLGSKADDGPANPGVYDVVIEDSGTRQKDSCQGCFAVASAAPVQVLTATPGGLAQGGDANITVKGNGFARGSRIDVLMADGRVDPNVDANGTPFNPGTRQTCAADRQPPDCKQVDLSTRTTNTDITRRFTVKTAAVTGPRGLRITNTDGNTASCSACFQVNGAAFTSSNPFFVANNTAPPTVSITFSGPNVPRSGTPSLVYVAASAGSSTKNALTLVGNNASFGANSVTADYDVRNAAPGQDAYQPTLTQADGSNNACGCRFTVAQPQVATVASLDPNQINQSDSKTVTIRGTNFSRGVSFAVAGTGVTVASVDVISPSEARVNLQTTAAATVGKRDVTPTTTDGKAGTVCSGCLTVNASGSSPSPSPSPSATSTVGMNARYVGLASPVRVLDTRANNGARRSGLITLDLSGQIIDPNATTAVLNVTVTNASRRGFLVAYPSGNTKPGTSNVNFEGERAATRTTPSTAGTQANEVVVALPANKRVSLFVDSASAHVLVDLVGSFTTTQNAGGRVTTNAPVRALDTRDTATPTRRGEIVVDLTGRLPATSTAVILNVTVTRTSARGFVTVFPTGTTRPGTSNVNFDRGQTQANEVTTQLGTGSNANKVSLFVDSANASVIVDLVGAVTAQQANGTQVFTALVQPERAIDTRLDNGARRSGNVVVAMPTSIPSNATGVLLNVTATNGSRAGFVAVYPTGQQNPGTSNVNFPANLTQANAVASALGTNRSVTLFIGGGNTPMAHVIVDVVGYLTQQAAPAASPSPSRAACTPSVLVTCPSASPSPSA